MRDAMSIDSHATICFSFFLCAIDSYWAGVLSGCYTQGALP